MRPSTRFQYAAGLFVAGLASIAAAPVHAQAPADRVTVPLIVESNRPYIMLTFRRADGSTRTARFLLDTGGGSFLLTEPLARDLGLEWGETNKEDGREYALTKTLPAVFVETFPLALDPERVVVSVGSDNILPNRTAGYAEGMLPGHLLARYHVVFDYPADSFTLAQPGVLTPVGTPMPMPVSRKQGFPRTELVIDGVTYGLLLDTGASFTMVSDALLKRWAQSHPEWARHSGAYGEAATLGGQAIETMFVPVGSWLSYSLGEFGVVSQREGTFERYMSRMMTKPIVGSLAGNVLRHFRVELDYAHETLYLSRK